MKNDNNDIEIRKTITKKEKEILMKALDGMYGWSFIPIGVIVKGIEEYYFICKVKTIIENIQINKAKVHIKTERNKEPQLLSIEDII